MPADKIRLRFAKKGDLRLVSHHDLMRCVERALRRAGLPLARTQGFNPRPKFVFALALGLGIGAEREVLELDLSEPLEPAEVLERLVTVAPLGLDFHEAEMACPGRAPRVVAADYRLDLPLERIAAATRAAVELIECDRRPHVRRRPDRTVELDLRPFVEAVEVDATALRFRLRVDPGGSARPEEVVWTLGLGDLLDRGTVLVRHDLHLAT